MSKGKKGLDQTVHAWLWVNHPGERCMMKGFNKTATLREVWERMQKGEDFYAMCGCRDSVQRELVFDRLAELLGKDYDDIYNVWLKHGKVDGPTVEEVRAAFKACGFEFLNHH